MVRLTVPTDTQAMDDIDVFRRLALALAIGLLLGLERGWHERGLEEGQRAAGIRTFALTALLGGVIAWLGSRTVPILASAAFLALSALLVVSYFARLRSRGDRGLTTEVALLLTFALGAASMLGEMAPTAAVAVVATLLLSMKARLHRWVSEIRRLELEALLKLALISIVILPLLPNEGYGPGASINPYELWWAVVVVAGLSFFGYVAIRLGGAKLGMLLTGLFGGLASSTSTTLALARIVHTQSSMTALAATGIVVAGSVTFLRILGLVAIFQPSLVLPLAWPMAAMAAVGVSGSLLVRLIAVRGRKTESGGELEDIANPLELTSALSFGAILAVVILAVHYLDRWLGTQGIYAGAALSGVTDVDALTISVAKLVGDDLSPVQGAAAIFIAVSVNTIVKGLISLVAGSGRLGLLVLPIYATAVVVGGAVLWMGW
jgi:uncharacterized membrane protein (DUF4010 family)